MTTYAAAVLVIASLGGEWRSDFGGVVDELASRDHAMTRPDVEYLCAQVCQRQNERAMEQFLALRQQAARLDASSERSERRQALQAEIVALLKSEAGPQLLEPALQLLWELSPTEGAPAPPKFPFAAAAARKYQREYAAWSGLPVEVANRAGLTLRLCPPGDFLMGSPADEPGHRESEYDETQHPVRLTKPYYLSSCETTVGQFRQFVAATEYVTDGQRGGGGHAHDERAVWAHREGVSWRTPGYAGPFELGDEHPVVQVSHSDAQSFCRWLQPDNEQRLATANYALPTEAQWEWACRAGSGGIYWWGDELDSAAKCINAGDAALKRVHPEWPRETLPASDGFAFAAPVGSYQGNAFGLCDMLGNVWEFCATRYGEFPRELAVDPGDLSQDRGFAVRGGGWSNIPRDVRCATRNADPPNFCHSNLGFRVALQIAGKAKLP